MSARKKRDARVIDAGSSHRPTTAADVIASHTRAPTAPETERTPGSAAVSPVEDAARGTAPGAWVVTTLTGSRYVVVRAPDGVWWFGGRNQPSPRSVALPPRLYRIDPPAPWPPVIGEPLVLLAPDDLHYSDPKRVPGGGKLTSNVQRVEAMSLRAALERVGGHDGN